MSSSGKDKVFVSASDVSEAFFCTYRLEAKVRGLKPSKASMVASKKGDRAHNHQNRLGVDRRCFVATYLYGQNDIRTIILSKLCEFLSYKIFIVTFRR